MTQEINYEELKKLTEALEVKEFAESDGVRKLLLVLLQMQKILDVNTESINHLIKEVDGLKSNFYHEQIKKLEEKA